MPLPLCKECGERHANFRVCAAREAKRAAEADARKARLERDAPGVVRFGDLTPSWQRSGETLTLRNPHPRTPTVHVPADWNFNDEPPEAA